MKQIKNNKILFDIFWKMLKNSFFEYFLYNVLLKFK